MRSDCQHRRTMSLNEVCVTGWLKKCQNPSHLVCDLKPSQLQTFPSFKVCKRRCFSDGHFYLPEFRLLPHFLYCDKGGKLKLALALPVLALPALAWSALACLKMGQLPKFRKIKVAVRKTRKTASLADLALLSTFWRVPTGWHWVPPYFSGGGFGGKLHSSCALNHPNPFQ